MIYPQKRNEEMEMKKLFTRFFARCAAPPRQPEEDTWLKPEDNRSMYEQWLEECENEEPEYTPDTERYLTKFIKFMDEHSHRIQVYEKENEALEVKSDCRKYLTVLMAALLLGLGWAFRESIMYRQYKTSYGEMKTVALDDGSKVMLNGNSSIKVPRWHFKSNREVYLKGEADFSVTHIKEGKQFVVRIENQFDVRVLGTEFSVLARERGSRIHLTKGEIEVGFLENKKPQRLIMKVGDVMTIERDRATPTVVHISKKEGASILWGHRRFDFNAATLNEIAEMLRDTYGFKVKISNAALGEQKLVGSYTADSAKDLLQALSAMMDIDIERDGNQLIIKHRTVETDIKRVKNP